MMLRTSDRQLNAWYSCFTDFGWIIYLHGSIDGSKFAKTLAC